MTVFHILAGLIALSAGAVALYSVKGGLTHRKGGIVFVASMWAMASTGAVLAAMKPDRASVLAGSLTLYLVTTALLTVRQTNSALRVVGLAATVVALIVAAAGLKLGLDATYSPNGKLDGYPPAPYYIFGAVALLGASLDIRLLLGKVVRGKHRLVRHLWRMGVALLIAAVSFFLGQAKVFPEAIRIFPLLVAPVLVVLLTIAYWLVRVLRRPENEA